MNATELRDKLVATAAFVDSLELPESGKVRFDAEIHVYNVGDRESLAKWVRLMDKPRGDRSANTCWVKGMIGDLEVTVFYAVGLMGESVAPADSAALADLLAEYERAVA